MSNLVPQFKLSKTNNVWVVQNPDALAKFKQDAKDGEYFLSISPPKKMSRSLRQNRYYYGVLVKLLAEFTPCSPEEAHMIYSDMFLPSTVIEYGGKVIKCYKSTSKLDVEEFTGFIQLCTQLLNENDVIVPEPDQAIY